MSRTEGAVVAEYEDPELSIWAERCKVILQQAAEARCGTGSWAGQVQQLEWAKEELIKTCRGPKNNAELHECVCIAIFMAGLDAFGNVANTKPLMNEQIVMDTAESMLEVSAYSFQLNYLTAIILSNPGKEFACAVLVKYAVQQVSSLSVPPTILSMKVRALISRCLAQLQEIVKPSYPTSSLPSPDISLTQGASKSTKKSAAVAGEDGPKVLKMTKAAFDKLDMEEKAELTADLSAKEWDRLLESFWNDSEDYEKKVAITYYTLIYDEERRLEMLNEALTSNLEYLFVGLCDLAYVPRTPKVLQLLEQGLKVYPHLRRLTLTTIHQLGYPTTKWYLDNTEEDVGLLTELIEAGTIKPGALASNLAEIVALYPPEVLGLLLTERIITEGDVFTIEFYRKVCGLGGEGYLRWAKDNLAMRPDQRCIDAAVSGGHRNVVEFIAEELGITVPPSQKAVNEAMANGMLTLLRDKCPGWGLFPNLEGANGAAKNGKLEMLKWLVGLEPQQRRVYPNQRGANAAAGSGQLIVLEWLATLKPEKHRIYADQDGANQAASKGHLAVLKWLAMLEPEERRVYPNQRGANAAAGSGHMKVLEWLMTLEPETQRAYPDKCGADRAAGNGHLDVLKWLRKHAINPTQDWANEAATNGHMDVLKWLAMLEPEEHRVYPSQCGANQAAGNGQLAVLEWLATLEPEEHRIYPTQSGANRAAGNGHLDVLKWLAMLKPEGLRVYPDQGGSNWASGRGQLHVLKWLAMVKPEERRVYPDQYGVNLATEKGQLKVLKWLAALEPKQLRVYPNQAGANWAAANGHLKVLEWLASLEPKAQRVYHDQRGVDWATMNERTEVLEWMKRQRSMAN